MRPSAGRTWLAVAVILAFLATGCATNPTTAAGGPTKRPGFDSGTTPIVPTTASGSIGAEAGGAVHGPDGVSLTIPPRAMSADGEATIKAKGAGVYDLHISVPGGGSYRSSSRSSKARR